MVSVPVILDLDRASAPAEGSRRALRTWLFALIVLVFAMVMVGGATRLTESGLSITEWNLVTGSLPPLDDSGWQAEFERYRRSPQYEILNQGMSLSDFRTIYGWEWSHRELGRFIGLFYLAGFVWFAVRRIATPRETAVLAGLGVLLAAQGVVGWVMVASGLKPGMVAVAPVKLALHLTLAALLFAALVTIFVRFGGAVRETAGSAVRSAAWVAAALAFVQIALGGLMAGNDAGLTYNTWPLMDGRLVPEGIAALSPFWRNLFGNVATIQFDHRLGAYGLALFVLGYAVAMRGALPPARGRAWLMAGILLLQVAVGIATLLLVVPIGLALVHQALAMILLFTLVWNASVFRTSEASTPRP